MNGALHPKVRFAIALGMLTLFAAVLAWRITGYADVSAVAHREQAAPGVIVAETGWSHGPVYSYWFTVAGRRLSGESGAGQGARYRAGQLVTVYFDRADPAHNALVSFKQQRSLFAVVVTTLMLVLGLLCVAREWRSEKTRPGQS